MNLALPSLHVGSLEITLAFPYKGTVREQLKKIIELWTNQYSFLVVFVKIILIYSSCFNPPPPQKHGLHQTKLDFLLSEFSYCQIFLPSFSRDYVCQIKVLSQAVIPLYELGGKWDCQTLVFHHNFMQYFFEINACIKSLKSRGILEIKSTFKAVNS